MVMFARPRQDQRKHVPSPASVWLGGTIMRVRFAVEWVSERDGSVLARCLDDPHGLSLGTGATLGGWPVRSVSIPRASPRMLPPQ